MFASCVLLIGATVVVRVRARRALRQPTKGSAHVPLQGSFVVVKLGGAAITVKTKLEQLDETVLRETTQQLATFYHEQCLGGSDGRGTSRLLILHGAGSFGHFHAKEYGVTSGLGPPAPSQTGPRLDAVSRLNMGIARTRASVLKLNGMVVAALQALGVPAVGVSPFPCARTLHKQLRPQLGSESGKAMQQCDLWLAGAMAALDAGLVPVVHGDVVLDDDAVQHCAVLGADALAVAGCRAAREWILLHSANADVDTVANKVPAPVAVFLTDVEGVYDRPPAEPGAQRFSRLLVRPVHTCDSHTNGGACAELLVDGGNAQPPQPLHVRTSSLCHDVTGGLRAKLDAAVECVACTGADVYIARAGSSAAAEALRGRMSDGSGTIITKV